MIFLFNACTVEKKWTRAVVLHLSVLGDDLVLFVVHSLRPRFSKEDCFKLYWLKQIELNPTITSFMFFPLCTVIPLINNVLKI